MTNPHESETGVRNDRVSQPPMPGWVKVFVGIVLVVIVILVILHLTGNSPGMHMHMSMTNGAQPQ